MFRNSGVSAISVFVIALSLSFLSVASWAAMSSGGGGHCQGRPGFVDNIGFYHPAETCGGSHGGGGGGGGNPPGMAKRQCIRQCKVKNECKSKGAQKTTCQNQCVSICS